MSRTLYNKLFFYLYVYWWEALMYVRPYFDMNGAMTGKVTIVQFYIGTNNIHFVHSHLQGMELMSYVNSYCPCFSPFVCD